MKSIYIIDDSQSTLEILRKVLKNQGYEVEVFLDALTAIERIKKAIPDLIIMDVSMPAMNGTEAIDIIYRINKDIKIVIMTAYANNEISQFFLNKGVIDFIIKPFSFNNIVTVINTAFAMNKKEKIEESLKDKRMNIIGKNKQISKCIDKALKICNTDLSVLLCGEIGSGKETLADFIHFNSLRKYNPLIKVYGGSISERYAENEFFGFGKDEYNHSTLTGKLEQADKGTLYIDAIGEIDLHIQKKLLHSLEFKSFQRMGDKRTIESDFRLISATSTGLSDAIDHNTFREDLFHRISSVQIDLPPLRDRKEDIPLLVKFFIEKFRQEYMVTTEDITDEALGILMEYNWPGNIRELKNVTQSMASLETGQKIREENIPKYIISSLQKNTNLDTRNLSLRQVEKLHIIKVFESTNRNRNKTADILGISTKTLYNKLREHGII